MNGDTTQALLAGVLVGVAATVTMDVFGSVFRRIGLAAYSADRDHLFRGL
jgi:hypothetical protein